MIERFPAMFAAFVLFGSAMASAEPLQVEAVMTPEEQMRLDFEDGSLRFVLLVRAVFVRDPGGRRRLLDNGYWEVVGGTGRFAGLEGAGTLHIRPAGAVDRRFVLEGELVPAP